MIYELHGHDPDESRIEGLRGERIILPDVDELLDHLGHALSHRAHRAIHKRGVFHLALSGGSTPEPFYRRLVTDPRYRLLPWHRTHVWLVDERAVPEDHEQANIRLVREMLLDHVTIDPAQVHAMPATRADGDEAYEHLLRRALDTPEHRNRLDCVLLGMGVDGHTGSLFPNSPALDETDRWVVFNDGETVTPPRPRMTMTLPLINTGRYIAVLVTGEGKRATLQRVAVERDNRHDLPINGVEPAYPDGELVWYLDTAAVAGPPGG